jgi:hypothetical protein
VLGSYEYCNESSESIKGREFLDYLTECTISVSRPLLHGVNYCFVVLFEDISSTDYIALNYM